MSFEHTCPDRVQLLAFGRGELDAGPFEAVASHLTLCTRCEAFLSDSDDGGEAIVSNLRRFLHYPAWVPTRVANRAAERSQLAVTSARHAGYPQANLPFLEHGIPEKLGRYRLVERLG